MRAWGEGKVAACVLLPILWMIVLPAIRSASNPDEDSFFYEGDPAQYANFDTSNLTPLQMREVVREMFHHAYTGYMEHAFPKDQLAPQSCRAYRRKTADFHMGNYALTLVESLSTLAVMGEAAKFQQAVDWLSANLEWRSVEVSVFEANIRVLGGLLSAHMLASDPTLGLYPGYDGDLLRLATELGEILLTAFNAKEIPATRINLHSRKTSGSSLVNLAAGTTFLLEFGVLSRLTGDSRFEVAAERAVDFFWGKRSPLNLVGSLMKWSTGEWVRDPNVTSAGVGSGSDSFYEYLLKYYILSGDSKYWDMWNEAYQSILRYIKNDHWYIDVDMDTGRPSRNWVDTFQAFFPSLMVLAGDVENATHMFAAYHSMWQHYGFIPEVYKHRTQELHQGNYPLRPELPESTWYLYYATRDDYYLQVGKEIVESLQRHCRARCGFAAIAHVTNRRTEDQMDSFFISETLKYLYLLFDEDNFANKGNYIFNTEGHFFPVTPAVQKAEEERRGEGMSTVRRCAPMEDHARRKNFFHHLHSEPFNLFDIRPKTYSRSD